MGVLIKDMEMPKNCADCPMYSTYNTCYILASYGCVDRYSYDCTKIPDWCPLSEALERESCEDAVINTQGLDEEIRCEMCVNSMKTRRGCDGSCKYDEKLYEDIMQILDRRIKTKQPERRIDGN